MMAAPTVLRKEEELLCSWAAFSAGFLASRPFLNRIQEGPWPVAAGWTALGVLIWGATSLLWAALLSLGYERSRLPTKRKQALVLLIGPAVPVAGFVIAGLVSRGLGEPLAVRLLSTVGVSIGGSLALSLHAWVAWRVLVWVGQRRGRRTS